MTSTQHRQVLTDAEMDAIHAAITAGSWVDGVVATFRALGVDLTDADGPSVSGSDYAIPEAQWGQIAEWCGATDEGQRVGHMLDWMNYGPSGFGS